MANWNKIVITNAGMQLSTSTLAGSKIQYTHVQTTSTNLTTLTHDQLVALTKFDTVVQDLNIGTVSVADDHIVTIPVQVNNQDVTADYNLYGMAIFAKPTDGQEILYGVAIATVPDLIPAKGGTTVTSTDFNLKVHVGDSSNVEITVEQQMGVNADYVTGALKPYVLTTDLSVTLSKYTLKTDLPDFSEFEKTADINTKLEGYATNTYVDQQIGAIPKSDMSKYNTAAEADAKYAKETDYTELAEKVNDTSTGLPSKADDSTVLHNNTLNFMNQDNSGIVIGNDQNFGLIKRDGYTAGLAVGSGNTFKFFKTTDATLSNTSAYTKLWELDSVGRVSINSGAFFTPADNSKVVHTTGNEEISGNKNYTGALQKSGVDVATVDDVSAKQDKLNYTPANDDNVIHRDPNTGAVTESGNFSELQVKGGISRYERRFEKP